MLRILLAEKPRKPGNSRRNCSLMLSIMNVPHNTKPWHWGLKQKVCGVDATN